MPPTVSWNETQPPASQAFSLGDDRIREFKKQFRDIFGVNHEMPSATGSDSYWGYHANVELLEQSADPAAVTNAVIFYTKEVDGYSELHMKGGDSASMQLTSGEHFIGGITHEIRIWSGLLADIPTGWTLCDGSGATPNLIAKFIQGTSLSTTEPLDNITGGNDSVQVPLPAHLHTIASSGSHEHNVQRSYGGAGTESAFERWNTGSSNPTWYPGDTWHADASGTWLTSSHSHTLASAGNNVNINTRPSYLELAFITRS